MPDSPVIDARAIERLKKWGGEDLAQTMIEIFLNHASERLRQITEAVAQEDPRQAELGAHSLKSSAGNVGASRLEVICQGAEMLAEAGDLAALESVLPELERAYAAARTELERILKGRAG